MGQYLECVERWAIEISRTTRGPGADWRWDVYDMSQDVPRSPHAYGTTMTRRRALKRARRAVPLPITISELR